MSSLDLMTDSEAIGLLGERNREAEQHARSVRSKFNAAIAAIPSVFNVDDPRFGGVADDSADNSAAFRRVCKAAIAEINGYRCGAIVQFGPGVYRFKAANRIPNVSGLRVRGVGNQTTLRWDGGWSDGAGTSLFSVESCQFAHLSDFLIDVASGKRLSRGFTFKTSVTGGYVSTRCGIDRVTLSSNGQIDEGIVIGGGTDSNNDFHVFRQVSMQGIRRHGVHILSTATQAYDISCHDLFCTGEWFTTTGNVAWASSTISGLPADTFTDEDVGSWIEVEGANQDPNGDPARVQIATVPSSTSITVSGTLYRDLTGATVRYGAQSGYYAHAGNFKARNGAIGGMLDADFLVGIAGSAGHYFSGMNNESSRRLLRTLQYTGGKPTVLESVRFSGDAVLVNSEVSRPFDAITAQNGGPIILRNCSIGDIGSGLDMRINWTPTGTNYGGWRFQLDGTHVEGATAATAADLFTNLPPTSVRDSAFLDSGAAYQRIGEVERNHGSKSGATTIPLLWSSNKVTLTAAVVLTFAGIPQGTGTRIRLHLVHSGGTYAVTFPTHTVVGAALSHSGDDWFELWTDGSTLWIKQL